VILIYSAVAVLLLIMVTLYIGRGVTTTNAAYYLSRRLPKVTAMILAAGGTGIAALVFQTVTGNRLLTPSVMGIDALFVLLQTVVVALSGAEAVILTNPHLGFVVSVVLMVVFASTLLRVLFTRQQDGGGMTRVLLAGVVMGILFRSVSGFVQMVIDPNEFTVVQDNIFASVNNVSAPVIPLAAPIMAAAALIIIMHHRVLDAIALGRDQAVALGVNYSRKVGLLITAATVLVASATAMVGPLPFMGLVASNIVRHSMTSWRHRTMVFAVTITGVAILMGVELVRDFTGSVIPLGTAIKFMGGITFLALLLRGEQ